MVDKKKSIDKYARELVAVIIWLYIIIKTFIYDIDILLLKVFAPQYLYILNYKFFILIGLLAIILLVTRNKKLILWIVYISFYPLIIFLWKIPYKIFKINSWSLCIALINSILSFFKSFKFNFITIAISLISFIIIINATNPLLLWLSVLLICVASFIIFVQRIIITFKPASVFQIYTEILSRLQASFKNNAESCHDLNEQINITPIEQFNDKQLQKVADSLQESVILNRVCLFTAKKLRDYKNSKIYIISDVFTMLFLILFTVLAFAFINYGLFKINNEFFNISTTPTFFIFFYYSFEQLVFNSITEIVPVHQISQTTAILQLFTSLFLTIIFISIFINFKNQRYNNELNKVIKEIEDKGMFMEEFIQNEYKVENIQNAIYLLEQLKSSLISFIYYLSRNIGK
ncbi:MAG: hypothetical protein A4E56_02604 [Pelotomaculum sp. PtaU1.Bin065]|nr:MAG: hypothetical protein A4E56_02604 [Pelotomaculum sp. PtaU1.Bin065]